MPIIAPSEVLELHPDGVVIAPWKGGEIWVNYIGDKMDVALQVLIKNA